MFEFGWETFALLGAGLLFVILEVFFPSGGLLGVGAASCLGLGGYFAYRTGGMDSVIGYSGLVVLLAPITVFTSFKILPHTSMGRRIILAGPSPTAAKATESGLESLLGQSGKALTPLHPTGIALIGERRVDVITRGGHLESGDVVCVVRVEGNRVIVERSSA